jgi:hypothetical protein
MDIISWKDDSILLTVPGNTLEGADLSRADLSWAKLSVANLSGANLTHANLSQANLSQADLYKANLSQADLYKDDLSGAKLTRANLSQADLTGANLSRADLTDTILPNGMTLPEYLAWLPSGLLTQGGKTLEEVAASWSNHKWTNCPMATAFSVHSLQEIPECHRQEATLFVVLFDGGHLPKPI